MAGRGNPFPRNNSTSDSFERSFPNISTKGNKEYLFFLDNKVVNDMRIHTRAYEKKNGGLPTIPDLPRREYKKKDRPILEDSVMVGDLEELVEVALQEFV